MKGIIGWFNRVMTEEFQYVADEGVRLGIGASIRRLTQLLDEDPSYDGREALSEAISELQDLSITYDERSREKRA